MTFATTMDPKIQSDITELTRLIIEPISKIKEIRFHYESSQWRIVIETENNRVFLEEGAELMKTAQHLVRVIVHKRNLDDRTHFFFDIGDYRKVRENAIALRIPELVQNDVLRDGRTLILTNFSGYERLQVHQLLKGVNGIETTSVGDGNSRKLMILPTSDIGAISMDESLVFDLTTSTKHDYEYPTRPVGF